MADGDLKSINERDNLKFEPESADIQRELRISTAVTGSRGALIAVDPQLDGKIGQDMHASKAGQS
jgi:hypothetical protein